MSLLLLRLNVLKYLLFKISNTELANLVHLITIYFVTCQVIWYDPGMNVFSNDICSISACEQTSHPPTIRGTNSNFSDTHEIPVLKTILTTHWA